MKTLSSLVGLGTVILLCSAALAEEAQTPPKVTICMLRAEDADAAVARRPQMEKKFGEGFSWHMVDINGNGPTSAALARYDNPRAQKMYEFVRDLLEKKSSGDKRPRGIELVK